MLKIALTGAHGTGKTTLLSRLSTDLASFGRIKICREAPRLIIDYVNDQEFFRRGKNTPNRQGLIFVEHLLEEQRNSIDCDIVITDRTLVDHLSYTTVLFPEFAKSVEYDVYKSMSLSSLHSYDEIFKLPIEFSVKDDGVREDSVEFQAQIDSAMDDIYRSGGYAPTIVRGDIDLRTAFVSDRIRYLAKLKS